MATQWQQAHSVTQLLIYNIPKCPLDQILDVTRDNFLKNFCHYEGHEAFLPSARLARSNVGKSHYSVQAPTAAESSRSDIEWSF